MLQNYLIQFQFLFSTILSLFLVLGAGGMLLWCDQNFNSYSTGMIGGMGLLVLGSLSILANFFIPLGAPFFVGICVISFLGWIKLSRKFTVKDAGLFTGITLFYWIAGIRVAPMSDVPMYHIPVIHWMHESSLPFGLANLHSRFGFWNFWFSVCGAVSAGKIIPYGYFTLNIVLVVLALSDFIKFSLSKIELKNTWFCIAILILISFVDFHSFSWGQKSPNADFAGVILGLWCASYLLLRNETDYNWKLPTLLISGLSILIKLNQAYFAFIILFLFLGTKKSREGLKALSIISAMLFFSAILMVVKSFWASGCLIYPLRFTCIPVSWRVSDSSLHDMVYWITRWARNPLDQMAGNFNYWGWVPQWLKAVLSVKIFSTTLLIIGLWLISKLLFIKKTKSPDFLVFSLALIGIIYWFLTAPDIRFGYGSFAVILCLMMSVFLSQFAQKYKKGILALVLISLLNSDVGQVIRANDFGANTLIVKTVPLKTRLNGQNQKFYEPEGNECWESTLPCTPYFDYGVIYSQKGFWSSFEKKL